MNISIQILIGKKRLNISLERSLAQSFLCNNFQFDFIQNAREIAIAEDHIVFVCERDDSANDISGNIEFYDFGGKKFADMEEIVGEINDVYTGVYLHTSETFGECEQKLNANHVYCVCNTWNDNHYIIDLNEMKLVKKFHCR